MLPFSWNNNNAFAFCPPQMVFWDLFINSNRVAELFGFCKDLFIMEQM